MEKEFQTTPVHRGWSIPDVYSCRAIIVQSTVTQKAEQGLIPDYLEGYLSCYFYNLQVPKPVLEGGKKAGEHLLQKICTFLWRFDKINSNKQLSEK